MYTSEITISKVLTPTLDVREAATTLFEYIKSSNSNISSIELDFSDIEFMSRSFADQFHKEKMKYSLENHCVISIKNADFQILEILNAVSKTQINREKNFPDTSINIFSFSDIDQMKDYLFAL